MQTELTQLRNRGSGAGMNLDNFSLLHLNGKKPIEPGWQRYCREKRTLERKPGHNYGITTGPANGLLVLDIDDAGLFAEYCKTHGIAVPETATITTGSGGTHFYFAYPNHGGTYGNKAFKKFGFDIRGDGGQVVAPGSIHPDTGLEYVVARELPVAPCPDWIIKLYEPPAPKPEPLFNDTPQAARTADLDTLRIYPNMRDLIRLGAAEGQRSERIMKVINALIAAGLSDSQVVEVILSNPIGQKAHEKSDPAGWLRPQIEKARATRNERPAEAGNPKLDLSSAIMPAGAFSKVVVPERKALLHPWLKEDSINYVNGWRGCGKTWFGLSTLKAVSSGGTFGQWSCDYPVPCLYVDGEMTVTDDQDRINCLELDQGREPLYIYADSYASSLGLPRARLTDPDWREFMKNYMLSRKIKLCAFDNLASLCPDIDENSKQDWDPINQYLLDLRFNGVATILLHHTGKGGDQRGTSAREDNADVSIKLDRPNNYQPQDGARFVVNFVKARIPNKHLHLIAANEFHLIQGDDGLYTWSFSNEITNSRTSVLKMLDAGMPQKEIAKTIGISKGQISKIRSNAIEHGLLTDGNKLTQTGFQAVMK